MFLGFWRHQSSRALRFPVQLSCQYPEVSSREAGKHEFSGYDARSQLKLQDPASKNSAAASDAAPGKKKGGSARSSCKEAPTNAPPVLKKVGSASSSGNNAPAGKDDAASDAATHDCSESANHNGTPHAAQQGSEIAEDELSLTDRVLDSTYLHGHEQTHPCAKTVNSTQIQAGRNADDSTPRFFQHQPTTRKSASLQATPDLSETSKDSGMPPATKHESEIEEEQNAHQHTHASTTSTPIYAPKRSKSGEGPAETCMTCPQPRPRNTKHGIRALGTSMVILARRQQQKSRVAKAIALKEKREAEANAAANARWPDRSKYNERSLFLFDLSHPLRRFVIAGIETKWWDRIVLSWIFLNTIQLALYDPYDIKALMPISMRRVVMENVGTTFSALFLLECLMKILAIGFIVGKHAYLRDAWNYLDFVVVITGVLDFLPSDDSSSNLSSLRALRVMRPLRMVNKFPQLRETVSVFLKCLPDLGNIVGLVVFLLVVFGILGVHFSDGLRGSCYSIETGLVRDTDFKCGFMQCAQGHECMPLGINPSRGVVAFDNIGSATLTIFIVMTFEGCFDIIYAVQDSSSPYAWIFFGAVILFGAIFAFQLFLAVISNTYGAIGEEKDKKKKEAAETAKQQAAQVAALDASFASRAALISRAASIASEAALMEETRDTDKGGSIQQTVVSGAAFGQHNKVAPDNTSEQEPTEPNLASTFEEGPTQINLVNTSEEGLNQQNEDGQVQEQGKQSSNLKFAVVRSRLSVETVQHAASFVKLSQSKRRIPQEVQTRRVSPYTKFRRKMLDVALSETLQETLMAVICLNTLFMMCDAHMNFCETEDSGYSVFRFQSDIFFNRSEEKENTPVNRSVIQYKLVIEGSNMVFTVLYVAELLLKLFAMGPPVLRRREDEILEHFRLHCRILRCI